MMPSVSYHRVDLYQYLEGMATIVRVYDDSASANVIAQASPDELMSKWLSGWLSGELPVKTP
jgi:hypothetical protein